MPDSPCPLSADFRRTLARVAGCFVDSAEAVAGPRFNGLMELITPTDSIFLLTETREHPMHVGALQLFEPPAGAGPEFLREVYDALVANNDFQPTFCKRPAHILGGIANIAWAYDDEKDIDIDYHVRRSALPSPGRVRDLLELTSLLHGSLLDRHRPLWEAHFVEGLNDGRFASTPSSTTP